MIIFTSYRIDKYFYVKSLVQNFWRKKFWRKKTWCKKFGAKKLGAKYFSAKYFGTMKNAPKIKIEKSQKYI